MHLRRYRRARESWVFFMSLRGFSRTFVITRVGSRPSLLSRFLPEFTRSRSHSVWAAEQIATAEIEKVIESGWIPADKQAEVRQQAIDEARSPVGRVVKPLSQAGGIFLFMLVLAGLYLLLVMIFGGRLNFLQALSVATYASLPTIVIQNVLGLILLYIKSPDDIDPIKGQRGLVHADLSLLFSPADHIYLYTIGGMIGIFTLYGLWLLTTGLRNTGEKVSAGTAWGVALILWFIGLLLALGAAALFPSFVT